MFLDGEEKKEEYWKQCISFTLVLDTSMVCYMVWKSMVVFPAWIYKCYYFVLSKVWLKF